MSTKEPKSYPTQKIRMELSYDGTDFCGWQRQKPHAFGSKKPNIQETLETALEKLFGHPVRCMASGRTDAGVHALAQVVDFETSRPLPKDMSWAMARYLPDSVVVKRAWLAPKEFHSTLSATHKTYRYWVWNSPRRSALLARNSWWIRRPMDLEVLQSFANLLVGEMDYKSFQSTGSQVEHTVREIYRASWRRRSKCLVEFEITGSGFLKQMVRNIVGTQVDLWMKKKDPQELIKIINYKDRNRAGPAAPPQGLYLYRVYYPKDLDNRCQPI